MTKIVNVLSARMEMGSPMVCMYLLGHPDHYKGHQFALFYWQSYVREARRFWHEDDPSFELSYICLYDWVRKCSRVKLPNKTVQKENVGESDGESDVEDMQDEETRIDIDGSSTITDDSMDSGGLDQTSFGEDAVRAEATGAKAEKTGLFALLGCHPLSDTHRVRCVAEKDALVPNFVGPILPRPDQGDREYYCSVMLSLFKPWRSGEVLKAKEESWDTAFLEYKFTKRQEELMANFNLRYECLDAKDDFHAQMRASALNVPNWIDGKDNNISNEGVGDGDIPEGTDGCVQLTEFDHDLSEVGSRHTKRQNAMLAMRSVMTLSGWVD
ncbi:hypothetical protein BD779DRAFT_1429840, partial [Infundibulicybe gibba]